MSSESNYEEILDLEYQNRKDGWIGLFGTYDQLERPIEFLTSNSFNSNNGINIQEYNKSLILLGQDNHKAEYFEINNKYICIFEGFLYNTQESVNTVTNDSVVNISNAAFITKLFETYGDRSISLIKGVYSLLFLDKTKQILYAIRDRIGIYPLYYSTINNSIFFSSSVEALLTIPDLSKEANRAAIADHLCNRWPIKHETFLRDVFRVPPGTYLYSSRDTKLGFQRYWDPAPSGEEINWVKKSEIEQFEFLLNQAVERSLIHGKSGIFLSGGLDSITVATLAKDLSRKNQQDTPLALSIIFPDPEINEEEIQRKVALDLKIPQKFINLDDTYGSDGLLISALKISSMRDLPIQNLWITGYQFLALQGKKAGCKSIMTGTGGDEWLTASPYYVADLIKELNFLKLLNFYQIINNSLDTPSYKILHHLFWKFGLRPVIADMKSSVFNAIIPSHLRSRRLKKSIQRTPSWIAPDYELRKILNQRIEQSIDISLGDKTNSHYLKNARTGIDHPLVSMGLEESSDNMRRLDLKKAPPFLDHELVEFLYRTPPEFLNKGKRTKGLIRDILVKRYPKFGFENLRKVGATNFYRETLIRQGKMAWHYLGDGTNELEKLGIIDKKQLEMQFNDIISKKDGLPSNAWIIWYTLTMEAWVRSNKAT